MDAVKIFNSELAGLYECKPPISKAKMTAITKAAIRAIKFYKHVVQSVEKFIQKCKTEYKIPGLYVIDSIVRQSRHQFSVEKDVFAPRFAKNITVTFYYLFKCPQEDKSKVIRVLNLWQKNQVFGEEVIQPLFDLADPNHSIHKDVANLISQKANKAKTISHPTQMHTTSQQQTPQYQHTPQHPPTQQQQQQSQPHHQQQLQQQHSSQQQQPSVQPQQQQQLFSTQQTTTANATVTTTGVPTVSIPNPEPNSVTTASIVSSLDPNLIQQIQQILLKTEEGNSVASAVAALGLQQPHTLTTIVSQNQQTVPPPPPPSLSSQQTSSSIALPIHPPVQEDKPGMIGRLPSVDYDGRSLSFLPVDTSQPPPGYHLPGFPNINPPPPIPQVPPPSSLVSHHVCIPERIIDLNEADVVILSKSPREEGEHSDESDENKENQDDEIEEVGRRMRSRSRSASRSKRSRRRSKSPSDSRSRHRRSRSKSRGRRSRSREKERERDRDKREREKDRGRKEKERVSYEKEKEKERERKKRGLPPMKKEYLSVCSTTLWVGHLSKLVHQEELSDTFGEYGDIVSIDLIPPRGCAFICMNRRQDAARALIKLKNHKMHNKAITLAWAPGKGLKGKEFKDYWEVDVGCSYIPFSKLSQMSNVDLDAFEDGGMIDEETVPQWLKGRYGANSSSGSASVAQNSSQRHLPPPMVNMSVPPPLSSRQEQTRPSMSAVPPPIEKDPRGDNRHTLPPPLLPPFALQGLPPPGGMTMGAPIMPTNLPPTLPPPLGVPPPLGIPSLNVPPVSSMMGQPLLGVPPHVSSVPNIHPPPIAASPVNNSSNINAANIQDSDNMDVEMEDVEKQDPLSLNPPPPAVRDNLGIPERIMTLSGRGPSLEYNSRGREVGERNEIDRFPDGLVRLRNHADSPNILTKDAFHGQGGAEFRCEGFGTFGPRGLPIQRAGPPFGHPSGHIGIISRNGPNFGPRSVAQFGPQRGILPAPPTTLLSGRPSLLADLSAGPPRALIASSGIGCPRALGVRASPAIGGLIGGHLQPPRGLSGPPGILTRFGAPPGGFPRFGIITGPRSMNPPHPPPLEEEPHDEWGEKPPGPGFLNIRPVERSNEVWHSDMEDIFAAGSRPPLLPSGNQRVEELILRREDRHFEPPPQKESSQPPERTLDNVRNNKDSFVNGVVRQKEEESEIDRFRERDWDRNRDWERGKEWDRDKSWGDREKEWDRHRDRDREREKDWDRDRIRDRDRNRDRDRDRERERWRGRDRERDRERERDGEREFNGRYRGSFDRYGDGDRDREKDERIKERSYERPSRWNAEEVRDERRDEKRHVEEEETPVEEGGEEEEEEEESAMTWDNWATFATTTMSVAPPVQKRAKTDGFAPPSELANNDKSKSVTPSVVGSISDNSHSALIGTEKDKVFSKVEEKNKNTNTNHSPAGGLSALQDNETSLPLDRNVSPQKNCSNFNVFENIPRKLDSVNSDKLEMIENSEADPDDECTNQSNVCRESMEADVQNVQDKDSASEPSVQEKITSKCISQEQHSISTLSVQEVYSATISAQETDSIPLSVQESDTTSLSVPKEESTTAASVHERENVKTLCDDERGSALEKLVAPDVRNGNKQDCVLYEHALTSEVSLINEPTMDDYLLEKELEATLTNRVALPYHSEQVKLTRPDELQCTKEEISIFGCIEQKCTNNEDTHFYDARGSEEAKFFKHESDLIAHVEEQENTKITSDDNHNYRPLERDANQNDFSNGSSKQNVSKPQSIRDESVKIYEPELKMSEHDCNVGNLCEQVTLSGTQCGQDAGTLELSERNDMHDTIERSFSRSELDSEGGDKAYISYRSSETEVDSAVPYYDLNIRDEEVKVSDSCSYSENLCSITREGISALSCLDELGESREACNSLSLDDRLFSVDDGNDPSLDVLFHGDKEKLRSCYISSGDQLSSYIGDLSNHGGDASCSADIDSINRLAEGSEEFPQSGSSEEKYLVTRASHSFDTCEEEKVEVDASQFPPKSSVSVDDSLIGCVTPCSNNLGVNEEASSEASLDEISSQTDS